MCATPSIIPNHGPVACRKCWQCAERRIEDWVGRNIAESKTAKASHVVTLTYGEDFSTGEIDHLRASVLTYSDVQKFLKLLRIRGYPCRYFAVGEYGHMKGRAHWHVILYWQDKVPDIELRKSLHSPYWVEVVGKTHIPRGFVYWDDMSPETIRYACKYLQKGKDDPEHQGFGPMPSKKPPLGDAYFKWLAEQYVEQGLAPQDLFYSFPDIRKDGRPRRFLLNGKSAENFLLHFGAKWIERYNDDPPESEPYWSLQAKRLDEYIEANTPMQFNRLARVPKPLASPPSGGPVYWSETRNHFYSDTAQGRLWFSYDTEGDCIWHEKIGPEPTKQCAVQLRLLGPKQGSYNTAKNGG